MNNKKFYITTPIYYPNAKPHLGTLYSTLLADVAARWQKIMGKEVFFITGTDEHGQKIQEAAQAKNMQPKEFIDTMIPAFKEVWQLYEIEYNRFMRTTDTDHYAGVSNWVLKLLEQGDIYKSTYTGLYCVPCETFITVNEALKDEAGIYTCPTHKKRLQELSEESYFFRLSAYQDQLVDFYEKHPDFIVPKERMAEVVSFVKAGLKDLSISRKTVTWGIPFPGDPAHRIYVWADALNNYITAIGYGQDSEDAHKQFMKWWPADVQVMAKDIVRFHAVYWPAFLIAAGIPLPKKLLVHGYILMDAQKMSKSLGNAADPVQLAQWYGVEPVRYYLTRQMSITHDGHFDLKDLENRIEADLANSLGNLLNRVVTLAQNNGLHEVKPLLSFQASTVALSQKFQETYRIYWEEMNKYYFHVALAELWKFIADVNAYFHAQQPWILAKNNKELFTEVIYATCHSLYNIGVMLWPVMPQKMESMLVSLGCSIDLSINYEQQLRKNTWDKTFKLSKQLEPLFIKPESHVTVVAVPQEQPKSSGAEASVQEIGIEDFAKCHLAVGTILTCQTVNGSDKLYKLEVDFGSIGIRQILSGVAQYFKPEDLVGKQGVAVINLRPRKMMGLISHGMMLFAADEKGKHTLTTIAGVVENGAKVK